MAFKIALRAGHYYDEPGRRCIKILDPNQTHEWTLNARICEKVETKLKDYTGYELKRIDDRTGKTKVTNEAGAAAANTWGATVYVSVHHNSADTSQSLAGKWSGGGIMAFIYPNVDSYTKYMQKLLYDNLIKYTGLKGNRADPLATADYAELRLTRMPAVLLECGFMDSTVDTPIILTDKFDDECAQGIVDSLVSFGNLKPAVTAPPPVDPGPEPTPTPPPETDGVDVNYQVYTTKSKWLPIVKNTTDYAGLPGQPVQCVYASLSEGSIVYAIHMIESSKNYWLPEVTDMTDYAGMYGRDADGIKMRLLDLPDYSVMYRVSLVGGNYLPWVKDYTDYAGIYGMRFDKLEVKIVKNQ